MAGSRASCGRAGQHSGGPSAPQPQRDALRGSHRGLPSPSLALLVSEGGTELFSVHAPLARRPVGTVVINYLSCRCVTSAPSGGVCLVRE